MRWRRAVAPVGYSTGTAVTTKRYYTLGNTVVAVRDSAGTGSLNYLLGDQLGSTTTSVNASTGATATQRFLPYGAPRSGSITATDRGWIGQTKDASTGLQYLNARYYDPTIGRFTSVDPIVDPGRPISLDRYGYGDASPVTLKDPTGLRPLECDQGWSCQGPDRVGGGWTVTNPPPRPAPRQRGVVVHHSGFSTDPQPSPSNLAAQVVQQPRYLTNGYVDLFSSGDCVVGLDGCEIFATFISEAELLEAFLRWSEVEDALGYIGPLPDFFADVFGEIATYSGYVEAALVVPKPWTAATAPAAATAGAVSMTSSGLEFVLGIATGDRGHIRAGGVGVVSAGFSRSAGVIAEGVGATARQQGIVEVIATFYEEYGQILAGAG